MSDDLVDRGVHRRAVEAGVWGMAAVNYEVMRSVLSPDGKNEFLYWSGLLDWRNQTLTPNPDLIYYMAFMDPGRDGPIVVEIPPASEDHVLNGSLCNIWQVPFIGLKRLGVGQFYLVNLRDRDGNLFRPDRTYRLRVPAGVPVSQFGRSPLRRQRPHLHPREHEVLGVVPGAWSTHERRRHGRRVLRRRSS